jgi:kynureninase
LTVILEKESIVDTRERCLESDRLDPLAPFRAEFELPERLIYLDGNSLGVPPKRARSRSLDVLEKEWGDGLIRSWNSAGWFEMPVRLGEKLGRLLGAGRGEVIVTDTTSLNLFKALAAALRIQEASKPGRRVIVSERDNFPSDLYMTQGLIDLLQQGHRLHLVDDKHPLEQQLDDEVAIVLLSHVNYRTGAMHDMVKVTALAHRHGAMAIWDLAHSAGAVPIDLNGAGADFAVGCTYKYLNGGPGAPAFIWVSPRHQDRFWQPLSGWWGHQAPFAMSADYQPASGIRRFLCGTQPILSLALVECGLDIALQADLAAVRAKSLALTDLFIRLVETRCAAHSLTLITPREHAARGSHVSYRHPDGYAVMQALIDRGVIGDYREPEVLRFGITPLYVGYADVWDAVETLRDVLDTRTWDRPDYFRRSAVT